MLSTLACDPILIPGTTHAPDFGPQDLLLRQHRP